MQPGYDIKVNLKSGAYSYSWTDKPVVYSDLLKIAVSYDLAEFVPEKALLISSPYNWTADPPKPNDELPVWSSKLGFSLAQADKGYWVSGEVLSFLWQTVNNTPVFPGYQEDNNVYSIALQIPGISREDPRFDCWGSVKTLQTTYCLTPASFLLMPNCSGK